MSVSAENFPLLLIEAYKDPDVIAGLKKAVAVDYDAIADLVAMKINNKLEQLERKVSVRDKRIEELEATVSDLSQKLDAQEQYSRRTSVRISGIEETENEDPSNKIKEVFQAMGLDPVVQRCHRVGPKRKPTTQTDPSSAQKKITPPSPRPILCQFTGQMDKDLVMSNRKESNDQFPSVFISEDLTKHRAQLLYKARTLKRASKILGAWSKDGKVLVMDRDRKIHQITNSSDFKW